IRVVVSGQVAIMNAGYASPLLLTPAACTLTLAPTCNESLITSSLVSPIPATSEAASDTNITNAIAAFFFIGMHASNLHMLTQIHTQSGSNTLPVISVCCSTDLRGL